MFSAEYRLTIDKPWLSMEPIRVDPENRGRRSPSVYVLIHRDGEPFARADVWPAFDGPFTQVEAWKQYLVVGCGSHVSLVDPIERTVKHYSCGNHGYFGHLYPLKDRLLIATDGSLMCLDGSGEVLWKNENLGIDGVVVDNVHNGIIEGEGEWDPPGGWRPFRLSLATGQQLET